jgi:hypothetical protein
VAICIQPIGDYTVSHKIVNIELSTGIRPTG